MSFTSVFLSPAIASAAPKPEFHWPTNTNSHDQLIAANIPDPSFACRLQGGILLQGRFSSFFQWMSHLCHSSYLRQKKFHGERNGKPTIHLPPSDHQIPKRADSPLTQPISCCEISASISTPSSALTAQPWLSYHR